MSGRGRRASPVPWLAVVMGSLYVAIGGVMAVLLPAQVERIDAAGKVAALGLITSVSFAVTIVAQPVIGAASDRTRSRGGGRGAWMLGSAVIGAIAVTLMGWTGSILALCVAWVIAQFALNGVDITASTTVVDEFPRGRRGRPSGALAASIAVGTGVGAVIGGVLSGAPTVGFAVLALVALAGAIVFVLGRRGRSGPVTSSDPPIPGAAHPADFWWILAARFSFTLGQQAVSTYLLYILSDHIGVDPASAPLYVSALTAVGLVGLLVAAAFSGWWSDRVGRRRILLVAASALSATALVLPIFAPSVPTMVVYALLQGAALGMHLAVAGALLSEVLPAGDRRAGRDLGVANTVINVAQAIAPLAAGGVVILSGGYDLVFGCAIVAVLASAFLSWRVRGVR